jgi:hypothetical protein
MLARMSIPSAEAPDGIMRRENIAMTNIDFDSRVKKVVVCEKMLTITLLQSRVFTPQ